MSPFPFLGWVLAPWSELKQNMACIASESSSEVWSTFPDSKCNEWHNFDVDINGVMLHTVNCWLFFPFVLFFFSINFLFSNYLFRKRSTIWMKNCYITIYWCVSLNLNPEAIEYNNSPKLGTVACALLEFHQRFENRLLCC